MNHSLPDYTELWRPQYHFSTSDSTINDPNGLVYYKGIYHLYYQCLPHGKNIGKHWGHATSTDLIHWKEQELALFPDDVGHMWSGTAAIDTQNTSGFFTDTPEKQGIVIAYSTNTQHIGIAYSTDDGMTFQKVSTSAPVLKNPDIRAFRDPHIFWHPETSMWKMAVAGKGGILWIYESPDLKDWRLCSTDPSVNTECPNLFPMTVEGSTEKKWILSCVWREYYVGTFDGCKFTAETGRISMNEGPDAYAGITFSNMPNGRRVMISWLNTFHPVPDGKWNGCFTVPVELRLIRTETSYRLLQNTVAEFSSLTGQNLLALRDQELTRGTSPLSGIETNCFELLAQIDISNAAPFSLTLCEGPDEGILLSYDPATGCMTIDRSRSKYGPADMTQRNSLYSFYIDPASIHGGILDLRLLVDVSTLELFVNGGCYYFVMRIHPSPTSLRMSLRYQDCLKIRSLLVNQCRSIWFDGACPNVSLPENTPARIPGAIVHDVDLCVPVWYAAHATVENENNIFMHKFGSGVAAILADTLPDLTLSTNVIFHGTGIANILFRMTDKDNYYCIRMDARSGSIQFLKKSNAVLQEIKTIGRSFSLHTPYHLRMQAAGSSIRVFLGNACVISAADTSLADGKLGLCVHVADVSFRDVDYSALT